MSEVCTIHETSISAAWSRALLKMLMPGVVEVAPMIVSIDLNETEGFAGETEVKQLLDQRIVDLKRSDKKFAKLQCTSTVSNTIFPSSMWNRKSADGTEKLFERFERAWPKIKKCHQNRRGSYFQRMTAFRASGADKPINQLQHIINAYQSGNHRRSALQATVFDPALDHVNSRQLGFPCLHQVAFCPVGTDELRVTAFYASQYIFDRALGNYLGLCHLGDFMAKQLGLRFTGITCIASVAQLGTPGKTELRTLEAELKSILEATPRTAA